MNQTDELCNLLPWYINGTLESDEMIQIETHIEQCCECAAEIKGSMSFSRGLQETPREIASLQSQTHSGLSMLRKGIESSGVTPSQPKTSWVNTFIGQLSIAKLQHLAPVAALVSVVALTILFVPWGADKDMANDEFVLLTNESQSEAPTVQVIFSPDITEYEKLSLIDQLGGNILGEPSSNGVYRLNLSDGISPESQLKSLQENAQVLWAEIER